MQQNSGLFRLTATVALTALLWNAALPVAGLSQPAPPPLPAPGEGRPDLNQGDPPARVGRIAGMTGPMSFHNQGDTQWSAATLNYPVSSGNAFWTEPSSIGRLEVSDSRIVMAGSTEFDMATLDVTGLQGVAAQGEIYLHLRNIAPNEVWSIQTPRGLVRLSGQGRYQIVVGATDQPTQITVVDGAAQIEGPGVSLVLAADQTAMITGMDSFQGTVGPARRDAFLTASLAAERPPPASSASIPTQVISMPGGSDLIGTGTWRPAPDYGQVWYPPVSATWVPYREGHWAYVAPWGWTWIDDSPWGFAPFHYGRWIQIDGRWGWTPGQVAIAERPVYAPALVTFIGIGAGVALGAALVAGSVGWVPLGPREQFHPWYHASNNYIQQVNISHVTNVSNNVTINNYINRGAATSIPAAAMTASRPVQAVARPVPAQEFAAAKPIMGQQPIRPTAVTAGITPVVARQLNLAPTAAPWRPAPGPTVRPIAAEAGGFTRPPFVPAQSPQAAGPLQGAPAAVAPLNSSSPAVSVAKPVATPMPESGRPNAVLPTGPHPKLPAVVRPEAARPDASRPAAVQPVTPHPVQPAAVKPEVTPISPHTAPQPVSRPIPPTEPRPAPLPMVQRPSAPTVVTPHQAPDHVAAPAPHFEPQRVAAPAAHPEPQHVAPSVSHQEARPAPPPHAEPPEHRKAPNERS